MLKKSPYDIVKSRHVTEKAKVLEQLQFSNANTCVKKCQTPKYVFIVDKRANKQEIGAAVEAIYAQKKIRVRSVNTITMKPKERRVRGKAGMKPAFKKAIVTLEPGNVIDERESS